MSCMALTEHRLLETEKVLYDKFAEDNPEAYIVTLLHRENGCPCPKDVEGSEDEWMNQHAGSTQK